MRKMAMSAVSAALLLGASSLAMAAQPGASDQTQLNSSGTAADHSDKLGNGHQSRSDATAPSGRERAPTTTGDATTPKYDGKAGQSLSGTSTAPADQAQVKQQLEKQGYSNVQGVRKDRDGWTANAEKGGQKVTVDLDSHGQVKAKTR